MHIRMHSTVLYNKYEIKKNNNNLLFFPDHILRKNLKTGLAWGLCYLEVPVV